MKKIAITIKFMFLTILTVTGQENNDKFWDNVIYGGGFNVGFGSDFTTITISPSAIYNFSDVFSSGVSLSYLYSKNIFLNTKANVY